MVDRRELVVDRRASSWWIGGRLVVDRRQARGGSAASSWWIGGKLVVDRRQARGHDDGHAQTLPPAPSRRNPPRQRPNSAPRAHGSSLPAITSAKLNGGIAAVVAEHLRCFDFADRRHRSGRLRRSPEARGALSLSGSVTRRRLRPCSRPRPRRSPAVPARSERGAHHRRRAARRHALDSATRVPSRRTSRASRTRAWSTRTPTRSRATRSMSLGGLMSARYPSELPRSGLATSAFGEEALMLAEVLKGAGVKTLAAHGHVYFQGDTGMRQGFDDWRVVPKITTLPAREGHIVDDKLADMFIEGLGAQASGGRFFAWAHFMDPHFAYARHEGQPRFSGSAYEDGGARSLRRAAALWSRRGGAGQRGTIAEEPLRRRGACSPTRRVGRVLDFIDKQPWAAPNGRHRERRSRRGLRRAQEHLRARLHALGSAHPRAAPRPRARREASAGGHRDGATSISHARSVSWRGWTRQSRSAAPASSPRSQARGPQRETS